MGAAPALSAPATEARGKGWTREVSPVLVAFVVVASLTVLPYARAFLVPLPGRAFLGFFYYVDDSYNYLYFVQQAEDGAFFFVNKLVLEDHRPALVNLEWLLVGWLSRALGRNPLLAYRLFAVVVCLALLAGTDRWLRRMGLPQGHRLPALLLVATAGGLGGLRYAFLHAPILSCLDLTTGLFPSLELLANPHFVAGTALLVFSLEAFMDARGVAGTIRAAALGSVLGLVRPYDLVLLVAIRIHGAVVAARGLPALRGLLPLLGLLPVILYNAWVFYRVAAFAFFRAIPYAFRDVLDFVSALAPAVLLAVMAAWSKAEG